MMLVVFLICFWFWVLLGRDSAPTSWNLYTTSNFPFFCCLEFFFSKHSHNIPTGNLRECSFPPKARQAEGEVEGCRRSAR